MLKICLVFWKSEPQYAYKRYAYKKKHVGAYSRKGAYCKLSALTWGLFERGPLSRGGS